MSAGCAPHTHTAVSVQRLSTDTRPEVRNSGVRTLYSVVVSHGSKLSDAQWRQCFWGILFPLLRTVHHMSVTSSREEASPSRTGAQQVPGCQLLARVAAAGRAC